jgi:hypothetical protein
MPDGGHWPLSGPQLAPKQNLDRVSPRRQGFPKCRRGDLNPQERPGNTRLFADRCCAVLHRVAFSGPRGANIARELWVTRFGRGSWPRSPLSRTNRVVRWGEMKEAPGSMHSERLVCQLPKLDITRTPGVPDPGSASHAQRVSGFFTSESRRNYEAEGNRSNGLCRLSDPRASSRAYGRANDPRRSEVTGRRQKTAIVVGQVAPAGTDSQPAGS